MNYPRCQPYFRFIVVASFWGIGCANAKQTSTDTDATSEGACPLGTIGCPCAAEFTCEAKSLCVQGICISYDPNDSEDTSASTLSSSTTEVETSGCMLDEGLANADCMAFDASKPYCTEQGTCVDCTALSGCSLVDELLPICGGDGVCRGCREHSECPASSCNLATGACMPEDQVVWVDNTDVNCSLTGGTEQMPYCKIADAFADVGTEPTTIRVRGALYEAEQINLSAGRTAALIRTSDIPITIQNSNQILEVGTILYIDGFQIAEQPDVIFCTNSQLWLEDSILGPSKNAGIKGDNCSLSLNRSRIQNNASYAIYLHNGALKMQNSFIAFNDGGLLADGNANVDILYSTFYDNTNDLDFSAIVCGSKNALYTGTANIRNIVAMGTDVEQIRCAGMPILFSAYGWDVNNPPPEDWDNVLASWDDSALFIDTETTAIRAKVNGQLKNVAQWQDGDPIADFEGNPRPQINNTRDYAGADVP